MLNVAQIGVGYWGPNLLRNLVKNENCKVTKVVDLSKERREYVGKTYPIIETTDNINLIMDDPDIDAVIIATPVSSHFSLAMETLSKGKHVLVEKPMAYTVEEVDEIKELSKKNNLVAMVGHTFLFNSAVRYLKKIIDEGELGKIRYIYSQRLNLGRIRTDVDALWNLAPHDISIIQYLLDNSAPENIVRHGLDYIQKGIDDVVFMIINYPNRIMAHIHVSWLDPLKVRKMIVVGSKKMAIYDDVADDKIIICDKGIDKMAVLGENMEYDRPGVYKFNHRSGEVVIPNINFVEPLKTEIEHFFDCIQNGTECLTGPDHAKEVIRILSA